MKLIALAALAGILWQADGHVAPELRYFRYQRAVVGTFAIKSLPAPGPACAALDANVYAHSNALADVRLFDGTREVPYALSTSQTAPMGDAAKVLNAGMQGTHVAFDLEMPPRPYTEVKLDLGGQNYVATATVTGKQSPTDAHATALGSFTLFDLSGTGLGQSTTLKLPESTFPYLHVELAVAGAGGKAFTAEAGMITGAEVPPSREAQTIYTTVAQAAVITQVGRHSVANFKLPAHVPVERVTFALAAGDRTNFSRPVSILAHANTANPQDPESRESVAGTISRIKLVEGGKELREETLSVPATLGANMDQAADVQVWVENGDDQPLALASVKLEMRQRLLCFDATPPVNPTLYYGDAKLPPPVYDYSRTFDPGRSTLEYALQPELANPAFTSRLALVAPDTRTLLDKHSEVVWVGLLVVVAALGSVAYRSAKKI